MTTNQKFARTVRIAIPLSETQDPKSKFPKITPKAHAPGQTSWIVTQTGDMNADRFQELLHSLYDGVLITKASGRIVDVNARAIKQLQYNQDELSHMNVLDIIIGANDQLLKTICKNIETNRFTLIDSYCIRKDKTTFPAEIATNRLVLTKEGHLCFFLRDVTRRKKEEEELIQTVSKLRELDNTKTRLVANVSHELRTPLTIISSFVSLVHDGIAGAVSDQQKECLATALRNCERLANLIDDVLDLGRIESGREEFKRRRLNLPDLLRQCHHDFLPKFLFKQQQLNLNIADEEFPDALGDADKIAQVLTNLIGNANKFTPNCGKITVSLVRDGENARVEVMDNGPGITADDQSRLFEAFTQIDRPEGGSDGKGTGLGLTISKQIVEAHEGMLKIKSRVGHGSRFLFTLPVYEDMKAFEAFMNDRLRYMLSRNRKPIMIVVRYSFADNPEQKTEDAGQSIKDQFQVAVATALGCTANQSFLYDAESALIALTDRPDLNKETITKCLQSEIKSRLSNEKLTVTFASLQPDLSISPNEWLARAMGTLEPLPIPTEVARVKRVLVIDDDTSVLKMMTDLLARIDEKIDIRSTTSGYEACIHFGNWKPDLVIFDLHLPGMDGKKVYQSMSKGDKDRRMKFLAVSGYPDEIREIMTMGCDDCLAKPFDFKQFLDKVRGLLVTR